MNANLVSLVSIETNIEISTFMNLEEEKQLVDDARTDSASFGKLYDFYFGKVFGFVAAKVNDRGDAEDITSEVFMKALENLDNFEWRGMPFAAWLFTIARNTIINYYEKSGRTKHSSLDEAFHVKDDKREVSPHKKAEQEELSSKVRHVLGQLSEKELNVVQLKFFGELNNREIMKVTGLSESNVGIILYRTLRKIKPDLKDIY